MKKNLTAKLLIFLAFAHSMLLANAGETDISKTPLITSSTSSVKPNIMFILDDSGSMDWDFLPDWADNTDPVSGNNYNSIPLFHRNSDFNGVAYNPAITYTPPTKYNSDGSVNTTTYTSKTSGNTSSWTAVPNDGFGIQSTSTSNLTSNAYYYKFIPGEYCTGENLRTCTTASSASTSYPYPAPLRWCTDSSMSSCQAVWFTGSHEYPRYAGKPPAATITISGSSSTSVSGITVNGKQIMSSGTTADSDRRTVAQDVVDRINNCTSAITGNCTIAGYSATRSSSTITLTAPVNIGAVTYTPVVSQSGSMTISATSLSGGVPGSAIRVDIVSSTTSYPYPNTTTKASSRTDCAGTTCTYTEEMTNFANWWSYYRTRMQMMKTSVSNAFVPIGSSYRVGYASLNNNTGSDYLNINDFDAAQKSSWYNEIFAADPSNGTPLRYVLGEIGRIYAGKRSSFNGVSVTDPIQYSCQQNFAILSTDGYWNGSAGYKIDGSTSVGNQDSSEPRPYNDGGTASYGKTTTQTTKKQTQTYKSTLQQTSRTVQWQSSQSKLQQQTKQLQTRTSSLQRQISQLQKSTSQLQRRTAKLQTRTSSNSGSTWTSWSDTSSCQWDNTSSSRRQCQYATFSSYSDVSSCDPNAKSTNSSHNTTWSGDAVECQYTAWSAWSNAATCSTQAQDTTDPYTVNPTATKCQTIISSPYSNVSSCTTTVTPDASGQTFQCQYSAPSAWSGTASCTAVAGSTGPTYTVANVVECNEPIVSPFTNAGTCTATTTPDASGYTYQCQYTAYSAYTNSTPCTQISPDATNPYTIGTAIECRQTYNNSVTDNGYVGTASCTPDTNEGDDGRTVSCNSVNTGPTLVTSCTASAASASNDYVRTECTVDTITAATPVATCSNVDASASNGYVATVCTTTTTGPTTVSSCTAESASPSNSYTTTTCSTISTSGGTSNTLADVAQYYYINDLRTNALGNCTGSPVPPATTGNVLCSSTDPDPYNNVPTSGFDGNSAQHMTTFTLGLGIPGYMQFNSSYASATSGDFYDVKNGTIANPTAGICAWQASGSCNWPTPSSDSQANIDDLWHAAVNGRGSYFSAGNPAALSAGLASALAGVSARTGAAAAAATSNPNVVAGDNFLFSSTFTTNTWDGQLVRRQIDTVTAEILPTIDWDARSLLDAKATRTIYTYDSTAGSKLKAFNWSSLTSTEQAYFTTPNISSLSQFCSSGPTCLSAASQSSASGENLVNFIRGTRSHEGSATDLTKYYRQRAHILGDIVNAEAVYVKGSVFDYADAGYASFATSVSARNGMVYVAANDGMLHAFHSSDATGITGGDEAWAYIPSQMLPKLYKLADKNYGTQHEYFVDGTPVSGDVCVSSCGTSTAVWKTILVGGFNSGARGYYALDITDPTSPKALWEFTDTNLGYTFGNPQITKLSDGTWVVIVSSGYNNVSPGDGKGRIYILNAGTGALVTSVNPSGSQPGVISTGFGSSGTMTGCPSAPCPSGLAKISARVVNPSTDNTVTAIYGGDMYGNLWRFDVNGDIGASGYEAHLLAVLKNDAGDLQPITTKPELGTVSMHEVVYIGTGRYIGVSDLTDTKTQTFYAIKDALDTTTFDNPRNPANSFIEQTITTTTCPVGTSETVCSSGETVRTGSSNAVDFSQDNGWYMDLPDTGERSNTDPVLALGIIAFTTNIPNSTACTVGGYSFRYFLDYRTGAPLTSANGVVAVKFGNELATSTEIVRVGDKLVSITTGSTGEVRSENMPPPPGASATRRTSWRELITDE